MSLFPTSFQRISSRTAVIVGVVIFVLNFIYFTPFFTPERCSGASCLRAPALDLLDDVQNKTLGFERIFAINLPSRTDHKDAITLAAAFTDITVTFVDGVDGADVSPKALPEGAQDLGPHPLGCWRAHMDVLTKIVNEKISSALIIEDDADWDIRIKSQLLDFARASRILTQPVSNSESFLDPTFPHPLENKSSSVEFTLSRFGSVQTPRLSPYGDNWEILWIGHCGARFADIERSAKSPRGRVLTYEDPTVVQSQYFNQGYGATELIEKYPNHTRAYHHAGENTCTTAYAVTQESARRILYHAGLRKLDVPIDLALWKYCDGVEASQARSCVTTSPSFFAQYIAPKGRTETSNDTSDHPERFNEQGQSPNIRLSTRINMNKWVEGERDYIDQFPDVL